MPSGYLERHYDPGLELPEVSSREELERRQTERINRALSVVLMAGAIPRRLGGDVEDEELALDKKRSRRAAHALAQSLRGWTKKKQQLPLDDKIRMEGAQLKWADWIDSYIAVVNNELSLLATWAIQHDELKWGKSVVVKLLNEISWVNYALRD